MKLLIATDLSAGSSLALQRAIALADQRDAELLVLHVIDDELPRAVQSLQKDNARDDLHEALKAAGKKHYPVRVLVRTGRPYHTICEAAEEHGVDLVVLGAYRKDVLKDTFVGTTAERVMRTSRCPVLMVNQPPKAPYHKPIFALDFSAMSLEVLQTARQLQLTGSEELTVVHAITPAEGNNETQRQQALNKLSDLVKSAGVAVKPNHLIAEEGEACPVVRDWVHRTDSDLLVMGTSGLGGVRRMFIGSVAGSLLKTMECDMLTVPAPE